MTLTECRRAMAEIQFQPTKSLGQNFLIDANILRIILETADASPDRTVLEIGPGMGVLTEGLLQTGANVIAVEKDAKLVSFLRQRFAGRKRLTLLHGDALDVCKSGMPAGLPSDYRTEYQVIANLPYSISTALLKLLVEAPRPPSRMTLMLQREVGERLEAKPGAAEYSQLTVFTQAKYRVHLRHIVSRRCFCPVPDVDSAIVVLNHQPHPELEGSDWGMFHRVVRAGFSQRRKQFAKLLRHDGFTDNQIETAFAKLQLALTVRAEVLSLDQFLGLAREFSHG